MIRIYTDGGTLRNGQDDSPAAYACLFLKLDQTTQAITHWRLVGQRLVGSNNVAELSGAIAALEQLKTRTKDTVITSDSQYVIKGASEWLKGWKARGWRTAVGAPLLNKPLWERLDQLDPSTVQWRHVAGHSGHLQNGIADFACTICMKAEVDLDIRGVGGTCESILAQLKERFPRIKKSK